MKRLVVALVLVLALGALAWLSRPTPVVEMAERRSKPVAPVVEAAPAAPEPPPPPAPATPRPRVWPPEERVIEVSGGARPAASAPKAGSAREAKNVQERKPSLPEQNEIASWKKDDAETPKRIAALLKDPEQPSALKLQGLEKLRTLGPEAAAPVIVDFVLSNAPSRSDSWMKPTALGVLADFGAPAADEALARISAATQDEALWSTIVALNSRPKNSIRREKK
jgi:hypothetical protein